jgi:hypothetical protein
VTFFILIGLFIGLLSLPASQRGTNSRRSDRLISYQPVGTPLALGSCGSVTIVVTLFDSSLSKGPVRFLNQSATSADVAVLRFVCSPGPTESSGEGGQRQI